MDREVARRASREHPEHPAVAEVLRVLGRTSQPILSSADEDREGYVPNVVYSCGGMRVGDDIFLPYGVADSSVAFAFVSIKELLASM